MLMQGNTTLQNHDLAPAKVRGRESAPPPFIVELAALICTGSKSAFWGASAAESLTRAMESLT